MYNIRKKLNKKIQELKKKKSTKKNSPNITGELIFD